MLRTYSYSLLFLVLSIFPLFFSSCKSGVGDSEIHTIDSVSGALNQKLTELKNVDTVLLGKALRKYENYRQFIEQNISDTITKEEADKLQLFINSGKKLSDFSENRKTLLSRGALLNSQFKKLSSDAKEGAGDEVVLKKYINDEISHASQLIASSSEQHRLFLENIQDFRLSISNVESLIKSHNSGQMPTVIKDSIPL